MHIYCEFSSLLYRALKVCYNRVVAFYVCACWWWFSQKK